MTLHQRLARRMYEIVSGHRCAVTEPFLAEWPETTALIAREPAALPVLAWLPQLLGQACDRTEALTRLLVEQAHRLDWRRTYGAADFGPDFLKRYGWTEIIGQRGCFASDQIAAGFLMLGPDLEYPPHSHEAEEIYIPLSGTAAWARGAEGWRERQPYELIHHPSHLPHAMKTAGEPLLALYVWLGGDLAQKPVITP